MNTWQPAADLHTIRLRAHLLARLRGFFAMRDVMEVETPQLAPACAPERGIEHLHSVYHGHGGEQTLYLQASPELHMKRLLAAGSGAIYQISRAFRNGEHGRLHNPEFTLLEWYRPGYDQHRLMDEVDELLQDVLDTLVAERLTYTEVFELETDLHPLDSPLDELRAYAAQWYAGNENLDRDSCLNLIMSHKIEATLGHGCPTFLCGFPASQAALARLSPAQPEYAERFEVYVQGMELANGFHELNDAQEQRRRFGQEQEQRRKAGLPVTPVDEHFFAALEAGLPDCAGIALGVDRLLMLSTQKDRISEVLAFPHRDR